ncbi:sel1 repeat family protein [Psychrobacter sp. CAM01]|uniref:tetratricopeptide repeat protein n=1 Tax=Psychrobacter sp. CAM01 TaxID=3080335 RepID=UPI002936C20F|nr:sel1 repeat family protein [Psychrobacter sp. CAM01]MDV2859179.1 sel1 repeat family protein [Psychrobacter sp. CAM01]
MAASPVTPLDYMAAGYWQDFLANRPIAGGMAYESQLHACMLDESLASLQRVDTLLSQIRRDLIKTERWSEEMLLVDEHYRNLMVFLAFYAGRVLAQHWQQTPHWYGQFELGKRYSELALIREDFYQHMAVVYREDNKATEGTEADKPPLFFALEPIGLRLFGHIDRPFVAVQGDQVASGLYQAVSARLPAAHTPSTHGTEAPDTAPSLTKDSITTNKDTDSRNSVAGIDSIDRQVGIDDDTKAGARVSTAPTADNQIASSDVSRNKAQTPISNLSHDASLITESASPRTLQPTPQPSTPQSSQAPQSFPEPLEPLAPSAKLSPTPELFTQLMTELKEIEVMQSAGESDYQQASRILEQFEQYIAKQNTPRAQVKFAPKHLAVKKQALLKLQTAAEAGNTAAMLRLAMYELLGEGVTAEIEAALAAGAEWVKQAASKNDSRGQRLLSKMYYQGLGVAQDIDNGKYWLEQAAKNGHTEAASVLEQWQQAQALITTQKQEQHSSKRYQLLLAAVVMVAILIFIIV